LAKSYDPGCVCYMVWYNWHHNCYNRISTI